MYSKIISDIRNLKIQGASNVAKAAISVMESFLKNNKRSSTELVNKKLQILKEQLISTRPTEPAMRNALNYIASHKQYDQLVSSIRSAKQHFIDANKKIIESGSKKIKNRSVLYTHCHSSTVTAIMIAAKKQKKEFEVHNTETRPLFQGRITASELAKYNIPVRHYIDSAAEYALRKADLVLLGADAITSTGTVINKVGSSIVATLAADYHIPLYICSDSWKFDPETITGADEPIELRTYKEIWPNHPKKVQVINPAFDIIEAEQISGVISDIGVFKPEVFVEELQVKYPWMFT